MSVGTFGKKKDKIMGFDITFHGIERNLEGDIIEQLINKKIKPKDIVKKLPNCDEDLPKVVTEWLQLLVEEKKEKNKYLASLASYRLCMLSAYYRECWYCRGTQGVSFWAEKHPELKELIVPVTEWLGGKFTDYGDPSNGLIIENYTGSGIINKPKLLLDWYKATDLKDEIDEDGKWAFENSLNYCIQNKLSFIEVSDVYSPMSGSTINVEQSVNAKHLLKK
jgi:hypothetical protein